MKIQNFAQSLPNPINQSSFQYFSEMLRVKNISEYKQTSHASTSSCHFTFSGTFKILIKKILTLFRWHTNVANSLIELTGGQCGESQQFSSGIPRAGNLWNLFVVVGLCYEVTVLWWLGFLWNYCRLCRDSYSKLCFLFVTDVPLPCVVYK